MNITRLKGDLEMVVHALPASLESVKIYTVADLHYGSQEFNIAKWTHFVTTLLEDENAYVVFAGDLIDCATKGSKTNIYEQTVGIREQLDWLTEQLNLISHKVLAIVGGNHPARITREVGTHPIFDVCRLVGIGDVYRENLAIVKVNFGKRNKERQYSYTLGVHHGGSKSKKEKFQMTIDGIDAFITGHTHQGEFMRPAKIVVDKHNEVVTMKSLTTVVCNSFMNYGGYAVTNMYVPQSNEGMQYLSLDSNKEKIIGLHWS